MRRSLLALAAAVLLGLQAGAAAAQADWRQTHPRLVFGPVTSEDLATKTLRWQPLAAYLQGRLGVPVELRHAADYIGIVQAMAVGQVHLAWFGAGPYAAAHDVLQGDIEPIAMTLGRTGDRGYVSAVVVPAQSPARSLDDLRGKRIVFSDPNSTSGFLVPSFYLRRENRLEGFFASQGFSGGHENSILAILRGDFDAAASGMTTEEDSFWGRMVRNNMIPAGSVRVVWQSTLIPNPAFMVRRSLPAPLKADLLAALQSFASADPEGFARVSDRGWAGIEPTSHEVYADQIAMREENLRRRRGN